MAAHLRAAKLLTTATNPDLAGAVTGVLGIVGNELVLELVLLSAGDGEVLGRIADTARTERELVERVPGLLDELLGRVEPRAAFALPNRTELSFCVFRIDAAGIDEAVADNLLQVASVELASVRGASVISPDDVAAIVGLEKFRQMAGVDCNDECMVALAGALDADFLVVGQVARMGGVHVLGLQLLSPLEAEVVHRVTLGFRGPEEELIRAARTSVRRLVGIDSNAPGDLTVGGPNAGAEVFVADDLVGLLPVPPQLNLPSGRTSIRVARDGYFDWESEVFLQPGETTAVWVDLVEVPEAWYEKWWVWAIVGVAATAGATSAVWALSRPPEAGTGTVTTEAAETKP